MNEIIERKIDECEILVRFIYNKNFAKSSFTEDKLIGKNVFLPFKGGVSLQRNRYCNENQCKYFAKKITKDRFYVGFFIFTYSEFKKVREEYIKDRSSFDAEIKGTPLDENLNVIDKDVFVNSKGNIAHADLEYINPAPK